jgi:hypothetical protein
MLEAFLSADDEAETTLIKARTLSRWPGTTDARFSVMVNGVQYNSITACLCNDVKFGFYAGMMYAICATHGTREVRANRIYPTKGGRHAA